MNTIVFRFMVILGILSVSACGLPGAAVRTIGAIPRTGQSLAHGLSNLGAQ